MSRRILHALNSSRRTYRVAEFCCIPLEYQDRVIGFHGQDCSRLMRQRVTMLNTLRGYLKQEGVRLSEKFFAQDDWKQQLAGKKVSDTLRAIIEAFRPAIDALAEGEAELIERLRGLEDARTELLESVPSIGMLSAMTVVSALDDAKRFDNRKCVANYGALTPTIFQTGNEVHLGRINRDGRQEVRRVMLQCAHVLVRMKSPASRPLREFFLRTERQTGSKKKAIVALARKLLTVCYGMLKSGKAFDPSKVEAKPPRRKASNAPARESTGQRVRTYQLNRVA